LVYDRTRSALLAAVTFAAGVVPMFIGRLALSGLADRLPRRQVMIGADLASNAVTITTMRFAQVVWWRGCAGVRQPGDAHRDAIRLAMRVLQPSRRGGRAAGQRSWRRRRSA
jgi:hypothetical protein